MTGTILITGANGSLALGFIQSLLLSHPSHTLIATVRNTSPSSDPNTARLINLITKHPKTRVLLEPLDLGSLSSVRSFADTITAKIAKRELPPISAIICNAFTWSLTGQRSTPDGYEATFQVSHLSHWLLVLKLLGSMDKTAGRVVMIGSNAHYPERANPLSKLRAKFPEDDTMEELVRPGKDGVGEVHDRGFQRYGTSKLANVVFVEDLNARLLADPDLAGITATCMDPGGLVGSRAHSEQKAVVKTVMGVVNALMPVLRHLTSAVRTTADAGRDLVAVSVGPEFRGKRGYFVGLEEEAPAEVSKDVELQKRLWDACCGWTGLEEGETVLGDAVV